MQPMLNIALRAARSAGEMIFRSIERLDVISVDEKDAKDYVTEVDKAAELMIVQAIRKAQRTMRQADRDNAKESMRSLTQGPRGKYLKWVLWGGVTVGGYLILRALGLI